MVAVLPDSSPDLWRLCHNLGFSLGQKLAKPLHLVVVWRSFVDLLLKPYGA